MPHETAAVSAQVLCTPYNHSPCHFMQSHMCQVDEYLAVTSHLHFWQNDQDPLHATAITRGWNGYQNKSQHRKLTLEKKILPPLLQGFEPTTFQSRVWRCNHWAIHRIEYHSVSAVCSGGSGSTDTCALCTFNCELDLTSSPSTPLWVITQARCRSWSWKTPPLTLSPLSKGTQVRV